MSLVAWYQLNGNTRNSGVGDADPTITTTPAYVDGKFGKALSTGGLKWTAAQTAKILNNNELTIAFWLYVNTEPTGSTTTHRLFGNDSNRRFTLYLYPDCNSLHWSWNETGGAAGAVSNAVPSYKWTHVCVTYKNPNATIYINGEVIKTFTTTSAVESFAAETTVIANNTQLYRQDFRVYNHALSEKEVKELAKGLVINYALKGTGTNPNLAIGSQTLNNSSGNNANFTHETVYYDGEPVRRLTCIASSYGPWCTVFDHTRGATVGNTYTWSMWVRGNKDSIKQLGHERGGRINCDVTTEWKYFQYTWTYTDSGAYAMTFYNNWEVGDWLEVKHLKVEEGSVATPYIPNVGETSYNVISTSSSTEYDLTGHGFNGTKISCGQVSDCPRYNAALDFTAKTSHITMPIAMSTATELSISIWAKFDDDTLTTSSNNTSNIVALGTNDFIRFRLNLATNMMYYISNGSLQSTFDIDNQIDNKWHHYVLTWKGGVGSRFYIDGVLKNSKDYATLTTISAAQPWKLGEYNTNSETFDGKLSDFRLYATALSADDVKELYKTPVNIDNASNIHSIELNELGNSGITENYGMRTMEFIENSGESTYTIAGSLTDNNGVFSGFSTANYITTNGSISANTSDFIIFGHYKTGSDVTTEQYIGCTVARNLAVRITNSKFSLLVSSNNGSSWGTIVGSTNTVTANTDYFYEIRTDGTKLYLYVNGEVWITLTLPTSGTYTSTTWGFGQHIPTHVTPALGFINLKNCGIIIGNSTTWSGIDAYLGSTKAKIGQNYISGKQLIEK